ncbi:MAG: ribosome small subunit-dependent GTPase A [Bacteroidetes bacterium]|nr:ribosome small subunit-dependent GTPase A [Bacteroidota bacterium]
MEGIVIKSTGSWLEVQSVNNQECYTCRIRGKFRLFDKRFTNPIAVGDKVYFDIDINNASMITGVIYELLPRNNYIIRKSNKLSSRYQIIASNIDLLLPIFTISHPSTSLGFLDRLLVTAEAYHIPSIIIFNKVDLLTNDESKQIDKIASIYQKIGYNTLKVSSVSGKGITELEALIHGKTSLMCGHSGTGKSTLINKLNPNLQLRTNNISEKFNKGKHTTTFAEMHFIKKDSYIIDTPGIRDFGIIDIEDKELSKLFPEFREKLGQCRFNNCLHINEPGCSIIESVTNYHIAYERYMSYLSMITHEDIFE